MSSSKQLHYSDRTFDIVPHSIRPRNLNVERGLFNQQSDKELKNPQIKSLLNQNITYQNPYAICQTDFCDNNNSQTRKLEKRNRTNIFNERLTANSGYINQIKNNNNNQIIDRFSQMDQKNPNSEKYKQIKKSDNLTFQEYLEFKKKMGQHDGVPKY
jgi:hypothetical protein